MFESVQKKVQKLIAFQALIDQSEQANDSMTNEYNAGRKEVLKHYKVTLGFISAIMIFFMAMITFKFFPQPLAIAGFIMSTIAFLFAGIMHPWHKLPKELVPITILPK